MARTVIAMAAQGDFLVVVLDNGKVYQRRTVNEPWFESDPIPETAAHPDTPNQFRS
jgi:hypothetical protein